METSALTLDVTLAMAQILLSPPTRKLNSGQSSKSAGKCDDVFKVLVIGDSEVGKSCLLSSFSVSSLEQPLCLCIFNII